MPDLISDAASVANFLATLPTVDPDSIVPVLVTIGRKHWSGAMYRRTGETRLTAYLLGETPSSYRNRKAGAYVAGNVLGSPGTRWYVSSYADAKTARERFEFHPLGTWWQLARDDIGVTDSARSARTMSVDFFTIDTSSAQIGT